MKLNFCLNLMLDYFQYFNSRLYGNNYYIYEDRDETEENDFQNLFKDNDSTNDIINHIESLLDDNYKSNFLFKPNIRSKRKKGNKKKKMKNYNIKKGDLQCQNCLNINFHFRTKCNICGRSK